mgnify:CR=1 FL=1|tara:strand:+ start:1610 stop:2896 length:1287 start_codon:yes stop_codon:yes gene_type:complete
MSATEKMRAAKERRRASKQKRDEEESKGPFKKGAVSGTVATQKKLPVPVTPPAPPAPEVPPPQPQPPATEPPQEAALLQPQKQFQAVSSQREFDVVKAALSTETESQILVLCGAVGCGKSYACRRIAADKFDVEKKNTFHLTNFEPSDVNLRTKLHLAARKCPGAPRRATFIDNLDGFTEKGMADVVAFLVQDWKPKLFDTILVTISSWAPPPLRPLRSNLPKNACLFIKSPRPDQLLRMADTNRRIKDRLSRKTPEQKKTLSLLAEGDIRNFRMRLGLSPNQGDAEECDFSAFLCNADVDRSLDAFSLTKLCLSTRTRDSAKALSVERGVEQLEKTGFVQRLVQYNIPLVNADLDDVASMLDISSFFSDAPFLNRFDSVSNCLLCASLARTACAASSSFTTSSVEMFVTKKGVSKRFEEAQYVAVTR